LGGESGALKILAGVSRSDPTVISQGSSLKSGSAHSCHAGPMSTPARRCKSDLDEVPLTPDCSAHIIMPAAAASTAPPATSSAAMRMNDFALASLNPRIVALQACGTHFPV